MTTNINKKQKRKRIWRSVVTTLAAIVVFVTTYALIIPAITWERTLICDQEEHVHTDNCYSSKGQLKCGKVEHKHSDACFDAPKAPSKPYICGKTEHTHTEDCYFSDGTLKCTLPEHQHENACYNRCIRTIESAPATDGAIAVITGTIPEGVTAEINAVKLTEEQLNEFFGEAKATAMTGFVAYDITIWMNGEEWQPDESVRVVIKHPDIQVSGGKNLSLAHVDSMTQEISEVESTLSDGDIEFTADGFSLYIAYTVDFHYSELTFSIAGESEILLSNLFASLNIERSVTDVTEVEFTNYELVEVKEVYAEDGIAVVDWKLISLKAFTTVENLTVVFLDNEKLCITVTDNVTYKLTLNDQFAPGVSGALVDAPLLFTDTAGNEICGKDIVFSVGPDDNPNAGYFFTIGGVEEGTTWGTYNPHLISIWDIEELSADNGAKYSFDHAEVSTNGGATWQRFHHNGWFDLACSNPLEPSKPNNGWQGDDEGISYKISAPDQTQIQFKLVYEVSFLGDDRSVSSITDPNIKFRLFDYDMDTINLNGLHGFFDFRYAALSFSTMNEYCDTDGFTSNHATVLPDLVNGYPVFNAKGQSCGNQSLGYLFGAGGIGVTEYPVNNTLLQKDNRGRYYYHSARNACDYDAENQKFVIRDYVEYGYNSTNFQDADLGDFFPFNAWNGHTLYYRNGKPYNYYCHADVPYENDVNFWFGLTMELDFYMTPNGTIDGSPDGAPLIFTFTGDDDVWVFIDDKLVLDLGGTHGTVTGLIDFSNGTIKQYLSWDGHGEYDYETSFPTTLANRNGWTDGQITYEPYSKHNLKFFYLERGAALANLSLAFNLATLPAGNLTVEKQLADIQPGLDDDLSFDYVLSSATDEPIANVVYAVRNLITGEVKNGSTTETGGFQLKPNEIATFGLESAVSYYVTETGKAGTRSVSCSLDGTECANTDKSDLFTVMPNTAHNIVFVNALNELEITKIFSGITADQIASLADNFCITITRTDTEEIAAKLSILEDPVEGMIAPDSVSEDGKTYTWKIGLPNGTYKLSESGADLPGYHRKTEGLGTYINVFGEDVGFDINNEYEAGYKLPDTGGIGTNTIYVIGALLMFGALTIGHVLWRRREGMGEM